LFPLLYYNYWPVYKFRYYSTKLLLRKNIAPKFKDTKCKVAFVPDLSEQRRGGNLSYMTSFLLLQDQILHEFHLFITKWMTNMKDSIINIVMMNHLNMRSNCMFRGNTEKKLAAIENRNST
jgi:hypothetical protein